MPEPTLRPCLINWCSHTWASWIFWIFKSWTVFLLRVVSIVKCNHIGSHRSSLLRNRNNYKNPFATHFTRFKVMKKRLDNLVLSDLMLNFARLWTFFHFQGLVHGKRSGTRWNLVSPIKYCDDFLLGSSPYAPLSLNFPLSLEAGSSPICPSWFTYLLLQPCLGNCSLPLL